MQLHIGTCNVDSTTSLVIEAAERLLSFVSAHLLQQHCMKAWRAQPCGQNSAELYITLRQLPAQTARL